MKKNIWIVIAVIIAVAVAAYLYFKTTEKKGAVGTAEEVSEAVPKITTNPGAEVPEINPIDRANPFKYQNPLR
ncbi:MAG: hypothetical protein AAB885_02295 [Patescibacteria group bacterium]